MRVAACLLLLLTLPACDEVSDAVDNAACQASGYADAGSVRATVDGDRFSGTCVRVDREAGTLTIVGADNVVSQNSQEVITLAVPTGEARTYDLGAEVATAAYAARTEDPDDQGDEVYAAIDGTLTVTSVTDGATTGTFSFTGRTLNGATVEVSGGRFDVSF